MMNLYGWLFHYNSYTGLWAAFKRSEYINYMDKMYPHEESKALFNKDIHELIELIKTTIGDVSSNEYNKFGLNEPEEEV